MLLGPTGPSFKLIERWSTGCIITLVMGTEECVIFRLGCCEGWLELLVLPFRALFLDFIMSVFSDMGLGRP